MAARVKYGAIITELKGSVGGQTFQSCRGGFILRSKPISPKVRTPLQSQIRTITARVAQSWRGLSAAQRATWDAVAPSYPYSDKFGDPGTLSGYELFMRANFYLTAGGHSTLSAGSLPDVLWDPSTLSMVSSVAHTQLDLVWTGGNLSAGMRAILKLSPPLSAGRSYRKSDLISADFFTAGQSSPYDLWSKCIALFGQAPKVGEQFFAGLQVVSETTGNVSQLYNASTIIQA